MTQSGQSEEPSARPAREGIVLPSDGGEPLLPGMTTSGSRPVPPPGRPSEPYDTPGQYGQQAPAGGQTWGDPWGPGRQPQPQQQTYPGPQPEPQPSWPLPADQQPWGTGTPEPGAGTWGAGPLPPETAQPQAPAPAPAPSYSQSQDGGYGSYGGGMPLPPAVDDGATQYIPPVDDARTQYIPPVPAADEGATQLLPPVGPGALPPESSAESTHYLGTQHRPNNPGPMPGTGLSDGDATQYIPPVPAQGQPPAGFENLFRDGPAAPVPAAAPAPATQHLPRFSEPEPQGAPGYAYTPPPAPHDARGGRTRSRLPLFAGIGVLIAAVGIGAGAMMSGGGGDDDAGNKTVAASAPATGESASTDVAKEQAVALDKLLAESGSSRASVVSAVTSVKACDNLSQAAADLRDAATQRADLVTKLSALSVDRLPQHTALTTALTEAWQASEAADNHYAAWADQVAGNKHKNCKKGSARTTSETQAGNRESGTASARKKEAARLWNSIAETYGLTQRQPTQL